MSTEFQDTHGNSQATGAGTGAFTPVGAPDSADLDSDELLPGTRELVEEIKRRLRTGTAFNNRSLSELTNGTLGGSRMQGTFSAKYAYYVKESELVEKYQPVQPRDARMWWDFRYEQVPEVVTVEVHIIGGAILPLWQHLKTDEGAGLRVARVTTDEGQRIVGIQIRRRSWPASCARSASAAASRNRRRSSPASSKRAKRSTWSAASN